MNGNETSKSEQYYGDSLSLRAAFAVLWRGKWLLGGSAFVAALVALIVALSMPNIYRAQALVAPNSDKMSVGLSTLAAQYGGLASLAGFQLAAGPPDKAILAMERLQSRKFISEFIATRGILVPLMAASGWDKESGELVIDSGVYDLDAEQWVGDDGSPQPPTAQEAFKAFSDLMSVSQDKRTGLITVSIEHFSPHVAKQWVDWLIEDINAVEMRQDVTEAEQAIEYLERQISATPLAGLQNVFYRLVEEQTKTVMLAKVSPEYIFKTIDPAVAPELKAKPKRAFLVALGMLFGGMMGVFVLVLQHNLERR